MFSDKSEDDTSKVDTLPSLYVPEISVPRGTPPSEQPGLPGTNASVTSPKDRREVPSPLPSVNECSTCGCRTLGQQIREKLDYSVDPCNDFYKFVCNSFRGHSEFDNAQEAVYLYTQLRLTVPFIPDTNQLSWQKAAGMYHACLTFMAEYEPETPYLVQWLVSLDLDLLNETRLANVNPVKMMVRGSLDLGVQAVIAIFFNAKYFLNNKRVMQLDSAEGHFKYLQRNTDHYTKFLLLYGAKPPLDKQLAAKIKEYDDELKLFASDSNNDPKFVSTEIWNLGSLTKPYATSGDWGAYISQYTNGTYTSSDSIFYRLHPLEVLGKLFNSMGEKGLRYLVAWKFFSFLVQFTEPYMFLRGLSPSVACYDHVRKVMDLAVLSSYLESEVPENVIEQAKDIVYEIRNSFLKTFRSSTWISSDFREALIKKMSKIVSYVGSPGRRLNPAFIEAFYKPYPDAPLDAPLFPTWIKALGLSSHYMWIDTTTPLYDETRYSPFYSENHNDFAIPTISMFRPFMYPYGIPSLNYGGLGQLLLTGQEGTLNDELDSENLADLVGTKVAYDAFTSLASGYRDQKLAGLDMSAQQLFFVNHCVKWCSEDDYVASRYAPKRSRCIVPLINMPEFSSAFSCAEGTPMNPQDKCTFW
ncbi:hypothetical protein MRX96_054883 [Rhipicephalus microplus]